MKDTRPRRLQDLSAAGYNPRKISKKRQAMLQQALAAFGDLGGIVYNRHEGGGGVLVSGHQRVAAMRRDAEAKLVITKTYEQPTANGTVAEGYVDHAGERFAYREVAWPEPKERLANLSANKSAGSWDATKLASSLDQLGRSNLDLTLSMFEVDELRGYLPDVTQMEAQASAPTEVSRETAGGPERLRGPTVAHDAPPAEPHEPPSITQVPLYFRQPDYQAFVELAGRLKPALGVSNVSDLVLAALRQIDAGGTP